ncbi:MAG: two-component regulator propeller domain-containing protein [Pseudomonadota bacterium]
MSWSCFNVRRPAARWRWSWLLLVCCGLFAAATSAAAPARSLRFEQFSVEQGLAQESVLAVVQDRDGFMWFGSQAGLSRYDGYRVQTYRNAANDRRSLADNWVRVLHVDHAGRLWVGTDGGLDRFDPATQSFTHYLTGEPAKRGNGNRHVRAIVGDGKRGLWIATGDGLQHLDTDSGKFTVHHHDKGDPASLADDQVHALARDGAGRLWVGTAGGLDSLAPGAASFVHHGAEAGPGKRSQAVRALLVDAAQNLWIGTVAGLETWALGTGAVPGARRNYGPAEGIKPGSVKVLYEDADRNVWVGTHADGLYRWMAPAGRFANYRHLASDPHSVADNQISALYRDRTGTFWVGTWYAGVSRVDLSSGGFARIVKQAEVSDTLPDNKVRWIADGGGGKLWVAASNSLNLVDPASAAVTSYRHDPKDRNSLAEGEVSAVVRDRSGLLWVGGSNGVTSFERASGRFERLALAPGHPESDSVRGMFVDAAGIIWIASRGGLHRLDPATRAVKTFRHDPADQSSLSDNMVRPIHEDRRGRLWIGTFNGLDLLDRANGSFRHYRHDPKDANSLSHDEVHYVLEDKAGALWVGTAAGLNHMTLRPDGSAVFRRYTGGAGGLADDAIAAALEDGAGRIWVSTNTGIARLDPRSGRWRNYSGVDGIIEGAYFDGSAMRGADGTLYFGGFNGITAFNPAAISDNQVAPRPVVTGFQVLNKPLEQVHPGRLKGPIEAAAEVTLDAADSVFSLEFAALHYAAPQRNSFAYQLEGFDADWVSTDASRRFATYTNLDPGSYTFRLRAANKDGIWSEPGPPLRIVVRPPYWKSWWFRTATALLALALGYALYRARLSGLRDQKELLEQQVQARTVEIGVQNHLLELQKIELDAQRIGAERQRAEAEQRHLESERQKEELERQKENVELAHRKISILSEIGREMTATLDMDTIMNTAYRHVHHLMDARIFGIGFCREDVGLIEFPFAIDQGVRIESYSRSLDDPNQLAVWCVTERRPVFINDVASEYENYIDVRARDARAPVLRIDGTLPSSAQAMMYVPLIVNDCAVGVMCVQSGERNAYRRVHLDMLQTLATHAAVALDNARAYHQLEQTQALLLEQEKQVRLNTDELALANRALQENDERLRLAKRKAEDATRQKSEFLANMSHEMRTPLAGVIGMLGFALRDSMLAESTREQIVRGQANAQSLLTIINDLLDFSKIEAGKLTIENIDFALAATIENVVSLFEEQAAAHSVGFSTMLSGALPQYVVGDPMRLRQVLVNLVGNAFKFTNAGEVSLRVERRAADQIAGSGLNHIRFSVHDTGIGIAPEALERLFQKFEQADSTTTRRYGGTGLGLAICRQLVELMDGRIEVESRLGAGSVFSFVLPLADGVAPPLAPHVRLEAHSHRLKVLCAEDFPTNQIIIRMMLEELGHLVEIADNGALAVAACGHTRYDLILMDGRMPEMDGASATRLIRAGGAPGAPVRDRDLMIVALTANASEEDRARYLACGMDDFLTKPIDEAALHHQLSRAIERQLGRGIALLPMGAPRPSRAELDAMFGIAPEPAPAPPLAATNFGPHTAAYQASELARRLRNVFAADIPARRAELELAIQKENREAAGRVLHGIRGSAAYVGAAELNTLCAGLEAAADGGRWSAVRAGWPALCALLDDFVP